MSYITLPKIEGYGPRKGLEGPFNFMGRVLYYCNTEGAYYDPKTDFFVEQDEMDGLNQQFAEMFKKVVDK